MVDAEPGEDDLTVDGLAVVEVPTGGPVAVRVGSAPALSLDVQLAGDIYDAAIDHDGAGSAYFENTPIRYAVGKDAELSSSRPRTTSQRSRRSSARTTSWWCCAPARMWGASR